MDAFDAAWSLLKALEEQQLVNPLADEYNRYHLPHLLTGGTMHPVIQGMAARRGIERDDIDRPFLYPPSYNFRPFGPPNADDTHPDGDLRRHMRYNVSRVPDVDDNGWWIAGMREDETVAGLGKGDEEQLERGSVFGDEHDWLNSEKDQYYRPSHYGDEGIIDLDPSGTAQRRQKGRYGIGETGPRYYSENLPDDMNYRSLMVPYLPLPHRPDDWKDIFS